MLLDASQVLPDVSNCVSYGLLLHSAFPNSLLDTQPCASPKFYPHVWQPCVVDEIRGNCIIATKAFFELFKLPVLPLQKSVLVVFCFCLLLAISIENWPSYMLQWPILSKQRNYEVVEEILRISLLGEIWHKSSTWKTILMEDKVSLIWKIETKPTQQEWYVNMKLFLHLHHDPFHSVNWHCTICCTFIYFHLYLILQWLPIFAQRCGGVLGTLASSCTVLICVWNPLFQNSLSFLSLGFLSFRVKTSWACFLPLGWVSSQDLSLDYSTGAAWDQLPEVSYWWSAWLVSSVSKSTPGEKGLSLPGSGGGGAAEASLAFSGMSIVSDSKTVSMTSLTS